MKTAQLTVQTKLPDVHLDVVMAGVAHRVNPVSPYSVDTLSLLSNLWPRPLLIRWCSVSSGPAVSLLLLLSVSVCSSEIPPVQDKERRNWLRQPSNQTGWESHHPGDLLPAACPQGSGRELYVSAVSHTHTWDTLINQSTDHWLVAFENWLIVITVISPCSHIDSNTGC